MQWIDFKAEKEYNEVVKTRNKKIGRRDWHSGRKLILDAQTVLLNFLRPFSACEQGDVFPGAKQISRQIAAEHICAQY